jgi:hypothetical protein
MGVVAGAVDLTPLREGARFWRAKASDKKRAPTVAAIRATNTAGMRSLGFMGFSFFGMGLIYYSDWEVRLVATEDDFFRSVRQTDAVQKSCADLSISAVFEIDNGIN